ncbi:MAG: DNA recombination protein RmuC [Candidatus Omnitrophica bacterium]|nr:DNA recombination protein RmuC [Candidatus Omnitrophota bacterium]
MTDTFVLVLLMGFLMIFLALAYILWQAARKAPAQSIASEFAPVLSQLQKEFRDLQSSLTDQVLRLAQQMNHQLDQNTRFIMDSDKSYRETIGQVEHRLGKLQQAAQSMMDMGKEISSLEHLLKSPKWKGGMGEFWLSELLKQVLPAEHYELQYSFRNGSRVDAVIHTKEGKIPVDAKVPYESFKRILNAATPEEEKQCRKEFIQAVKKHIDSIAEKYILPEEGTFDFALMYIPSENIYYEIILKEDSDAESLSAYALRKKILPVSPNSFYAYLQAIVRGLRGLKIEESALIILESLRQLETDFAKCSAEMEKVGSHLTNASSAYEKVLKRFDKMQHRIASLSGGKDSVEVPEIEPQSPKLLSL